MGIPMGMTGTPLLKLSKDVSEGRVKEEDQIVVSVGPSRYRIAKVSVMK